jgi:hypothetical protein
MKPETTSAFRKVLGVILLLVGGIPLVLLLGNMVTGGFGSSGLGSSGLGSSGLGSSGETMNINIESIGGFNVWFFIAFWMLSQCTLVYHARRGSKQPS